MQFKEFTDFQQRLRESPGKLDKEEIAIEMLDACASLEERIAMSYLLHGTVGSATENFVSGIKEKTILKALDLSCRASMESILEELPRLHWGQAPGADLLEWFTSTREWMKRGDRDQEWLGNQIKKQLSQHASPEASGLALEILVRKVPNKFGDIETVYALARRAHPSACFPNQKWDMPIKKQLKAAWNVRPDTGWWARKLEEHPIKELLESCIPTPGIAIEPQKADRLGNKSKESIFEDHAGESVMELKMDGQRCHVHVHPDGRVQLYGRSLLDITNQFPDVARIIEELDLTDSILDGELLAMSTDGRDIMNFDALASRIGKKELTDDDFDAGIIFYDCIRHDGRDLTHEPLRTRRSILVDALHDGDDLIHPRLRPIDQVPVQSVEHMMEFLTDAHQAGQEGIVVKDMDAPCEHGERRKAWYKLKGDYEEGTDFGDSIDLAVVGAFHGRGRRHNTIGALLLGIRDEDTGDVHPICKVGTGFNDEQLQEWTDRLESITTDAPHGGIVAGNTKPDFWVSPDYIVEIRAAEVSRSPFYQAGLDESGKGYSLRFPRILRLRQDKTVANSTSIQEILRIVTA